MAFRIVLTAVVLALASPAVASTFEPQLPGLVGSDNVSGFDADARRACLAGEERCVDAVIREMEQRFRPLAEGCDHDAIFALTYLRTTEVYRSTASWQPALFSDRAFVNHEAWLFALWYFRAQDAHDAGAGAPPAWRIAFDAAAARQVGAATNMLLGINAHVLSDLPQVLYELGLARPDGTSRKPDHDAVNRFLYEVTEPLLDEIERRFDPTVRDTDLDGTRLDDEALFELIVAWREEAWHRAEALALAPTEAARRLVAADIERQAGLRAQAIEANGRYPPLSGGSAARDAFCAAHHDDG